MTTMGLNYLTYQETQRANLAKEGLSNKEIEEKMRSNRVNESISQGSLSESIRTHQANEKISQGNLDETIKSHRVNEAENHRANVARETENTRSATARESQANATDVANVLIKAGANQSAVYQALRNRGDYMGKGAAEQIAEQLFAANEVGMSKAQKQIANIFGGGSSSALSGLLKLVP